MQSLPLVYFSAGWVGIIYLFNSAVAGKFKKINVEIALLYVTSVMLIGVFGEVLLDSLYRAAFGAPLWLYHVLPIHDGYTSYYSLVLWGMYGFYLYLLHDGLQNRRIRSNSLLAALISIEAIVLELLINSSHLAIFKRYIFYYLPGGLWHLSAFQVIPFYFIAGLFIVKSTDGFKSNPWFFSLTNAILLSVLIFFTS